ncbi:alanine racemase [Patulibacter defluvii]|uniref:alanine racemase n=1 Tax=Patulibacter defluvii TaxID=3095358 RepID=UPI002A760CB5|nr:alanine racemase [Patulibacter sp. DM4]
MRAVARVNVAAIERNVARLREPLAPGTALCAVVKADGYGHGAVAVARAALAGGARWLAVVTAGEATALRRAGIDARLLVMGPLTDGELEEALDAGAEVVAWEEEGVARLLERGRPAAVHLKLDSGMGRLGQRDPQLALRLADRITSAGHLRLSGLMTHFATADDREDDFFDRQLERFSTWVEQVRREHPDVVVHAANSAAILRDPASHFDLVRPGVAIYGMDPFGRDPDEQRLEPVLEWRSRLVSVKPAEPGDSVGYGRRYVAERATRIGNVPVGYADGVRRGLTGRGAEVLVAGRRVPFAGTVSMDSIGIDLGPEGEGPPARVDDPVLVLGRDGDERITAEEIAALLDTINYEITCGIGARVVRRYHRDGVPVGGDEADPGL